MNADNINGPRKGESVKSFYDRLFRDEKKAKEEAEDRKDDSPCMRVMSDGPRRMVKSLAAVAREGVVKARLERCKKRNQIIEVNAPLEAVDEEVEAFIKYLHNVPHADDIRNRADFLGAAIYVLSRDYNLAKNSINTVLSRNWRSGNPVYDDLWSKIIDITKSNPSLYLKRTFKKHVIKFAKNYAKEESVRPEDADLEAEIKEISDAYNNIY